VTRILVVLGSGETAPTMVATHRQVFEALGPVPAVLLDTPYGFQENADDISQRAMEYFRASVGRQVKALDLRRLQGTDPARTEVALAELAGAGWVFSGPGSPTYALRQWADSAVPDLLADKLAHGGAIVFSSAAALTLGALTVPVYEIYKVGADPAWERGLGLVGFLGSEVAIIPHYDNAEGGNHDTRFCYLGQRRLEMLEEQMSPLGWILGVDEHTGVVFDLEARTASVVGKGSVTLRCHGQSATVGTGTRLDIADLAEMVESLRASQGSLAQAGPVTALQEPPAADLTPAPTAFHGEIRHIEFDFDSALGAKDVDAAVRAALELEQAIFDWSGDTTQSDAPQRARAALRRMIARLGELARTGARDPKETVGGLVEALLEQRAKAREQRRYEDADSIRDHLLASGIEVRDTPTGTVWELAGLP